MNQKETHKLIGKLGSAIVFLSVVVVGLIITILVLFAFQGAKDDEKLEDLSFCGNSFRNPTNDKPNYRYGEQLFNQNCASCHYPDKDMTGPALKGARARGDDNSYEGWIYDFIRNEDSLIQIEDTYTLNLNDGGWGINWSHREPLTNSEIDDLFDYID